MFKLAENKTTVSREFFAGLTTFVTMAYIIAVNPSILSEAGMEWGAVFLATIISAVIGTLMMGLFANIPYAQAPGMGLNAFFTYTVCFGLKFSWQQALGMVFLCGILNIIVTITKVRTQLIRAIPKALQHAIAGGIGLFLAYIGFLNAGAVEFGAVPSMSLMQTPGTWLFLIGLFLIIVLLTLKVPGAILISIVATSIIGYFMGVTRVEESVKFGEAWKSLGTTFGVIFTKEGLGSLFSGGAKQIVVAIVSIFAFALTDMFDTIGTFIGTGRRSGIFTEADEKSMTSGGAGLKARMERGLFADMVATTAGAIVGTSNVTTYVESTAGIAVGGRTGLTSVFVSVFFIICAFLSSLVSLIPTQATAPALIVIGAMMTSSFIDVKWSELDEAIPAIFAGVFMAFSYSITNGIATAFIFYCVIKLCKKQIKEIHPILGGATVLFILNYVLQAIFRK
ncbi:MAG: NCS2 family permease [Oscillospiraceae bacterium]|jgi:AGZA family xanthine/uracil permease-like MFS transporter|nr:NCS2 family permease [Oscillospiraceae bacterium]